MGVLFWIIATVVLLVYEASTVALVTIWFACGAFVATILSIFIKNWVLEWIVFCAVSLIALFLFRPSAVKRFNKSTVATNVDSIVGTKAKVTEKVDNINGTGAVFLNGLTWTAVSAEDKVIEVDTIVTVVEVKGVKVIVK